MLLFPRRRRRGRCRFFLRGLGDWPQGHEPIESCVERIYGALDRAMEIIVKVFLRYVELFVWQSRAPMAVPLAAWKTGRPLHGVLRAV